MRASFLAAVTIAILTLLAWTSAALAETRTYACGDGQGDVTVTILNQHKVSVDLNFPDSDDGTISGMIMRGGGDAANGFVYSKGEYQIAISGGAQDTLNYSAPDFGDIACVWNTADNQEVDTGSNMTVEYPVSGRSCGGILRSGPSSSYPKLASLYEGQPIMILAQAGDQDDGGYAWFKIKAAGKTGYQWGGIFSADSDLPGSYVGC